MVGEDPAPGPVRHLPGGEGEDEVVVAGEDADILRGHDVRHTPILCLILVIIMSLSLYIKGCMMCLCACEHAADIF